MVRRTLGAFLASLILVTFTLGCGSDETGRGAGGTGGGGSGGGGGGGGGGEGGWQPPIGIPAPDFGIEEVAPATPADWSQAMPGFYYVDATAAGASDDANPYGTPAHPRVTIPNMVPAGSVVELHGEYDRPQTSPDTLVLPGTAEMPIFIRGVDADDMPRIGAAWEISGSYFILENLSFGPNGSQTNTGSLVIREPTTHGVFRDSELSGLPGGGGMGVVVWSDAGTVDHVVLLRNYIHDNGDLADTGDQDAHGIAVGHDVSYLWVLENEIARNSGDGIQINADVGNAGSLHHVYVGKNVSHDNKQSGFWVKYATDVIVSQNVSYGHRLSSSGLGDGMGLQYAPDYVWFLDNLVYDCDIGIGLHSTDAGAAVHAYAIGNIVASIHGSAGFEPGNAWNAALMLTGGTERYAINNTILDVDQGIASGGAEGRLVIQNNVIAGVTQPQGGHVFIEHSSVAAASLFDHNMVDESARFMWGDYTPVDLASFQSSFPGQCAGCVLANPVFVDAPNGDLHLQSGSPGVDAGAVAEVYATFADRYGIDIAKDASGAPRPQGAGWDMGAMETAAN